MMLKKIVNLGKAAVTRVHEKIMKCFKVSKKIACKILNIIQRSFSAVWKSLVHAQGALRRILIDPVLSDSEKVQRVVRALASNMLRALIIGQTIIPDPTGITPIAAAALKAACPCLGLNR